MQKQLETIAQPLIVWFEKNKRPLPWRADRNPYHVWISEIMLQQTRIEAVMHYYARFMQALPDVESLSKIPEEQLLKLWEGLGYYSRAKNLKKAAEQIMTVYGGQFPSAYAQLLQLSGIGEYTAGAIASICFNEKVPAVDGNVLRVISRIIGSRKNVLLPETKKEITGLLQQMMPPRSGAFNEALMELGETVCLPSGAPLCHECPLRGSCTAYQENLTAEIPVRIKQQKRKKEEKTVFIIVTDKKELALEKRPESGLLSGMYQLPNIGGTLTDEQIQQTLLQWGITPHRIEHLKDVKHIFTHIEWHMKGYLVTAAAKSDRFLWATPQALTEQYPLPTAFQKLIKGYQAFIE